MSQRRVLSGGITQESHSFNPILTRRDRFTIVSGQHAVESNRGTNSIFGGVVDSAKEADVELIVPTLFRAESGGPVEDKVFSEVCDAMLHAAKRGDFDAVVLPLHGGMLTETLSDPEGVLFERLREVVGKDVPITAAFDLHAYVKESTLRPLDFLAGYLTNPHEDQAATAKRAFHAAIAMLDGRLDPVLAATFLPMLTLGNDTTLDGPLVDIHEYARTAIDSGQAYDVSIFNAQQFLDVPHLGQVVLAYGNGDLEEPRKVANEVMHMLWDNRDLLIGKYPDLGKELKGIDDSNRTIILGDQGDRVAAGGPGDSTYILNYLLDSRIDAETYFPIFDPTAVAECERVGVGGEITLTFGGNYSTHSPKITAEGVVINLGQAAPVVYDGPCDAGTKTSIERFAIFRMNNISVLLTNQPYAFIDPDYFRAVGLPPEKAKIIVTRSGYHYALNFASTGRCVTVDTPGMTSYFVNQFTWNKARPFYPIDNIGYAPRQFSRRRH